MEIIGEVNSTIRENFHIVAIIDVTKLFETMRELIKLTYTDQLTDILNRRGLIAKFEEEVLRVKRTHRSFTLVLCDIDHFKQVNDTFGHDCGDHVIVEVANIIVSCVRMTDYVGRWGGEEFCLLMPETNLIGAKLLVSRIREKLEAFEFSWHGLALSVRMTFGVAYHEVEHSLGETLKRADIALYRGRAGRDCVVTYQEGNY
ncbi:MAG: GGDEF domain-containing protein [Anaerolineae bacterium]|nr:GGDEF domain-containing protein [Anaerolineae bacterium]